MVFGLISAAAYGLAQSHPRYEFNVLMIANAIMFIISLIAGFVATKTVADRPQVFVRGVFSGTLIKLFACLIGLGFYIVKYKETLYKPMVFCLLGIYVLYSIAETWAASRTAKKVV